MCGFVYSLPSLSWPNLLGQQPIKQSRKYINNTILQQNTSTISQQSYTLGWTQPLLLTTCTVSDKEHIDAFNLLVRSHHKIKHLTNTITLMPVVCHPQIPSPLVGVGGTGLGLPLMGLLLSQ